MKKQLLAMVTAGALLLSATACGKSESEQSVTVSLAEQTFTGTVNAISADEISLTTEDSGTVIIPLSPDTVFQQRQPGMGGQAPGGSAPDGEAPPDAPDGAMSNGETPPAAPDGAASGEANAPDVPNGAVSGGEEPPAMPENGTTSGQTPPEMPEGSAPADMAQPSLSYEDISQGDTVTVEVGDDGIATSVTLSGGGPGGGGMGGGMGGQSSAPDSYDAASEYTEDSEVSNSQLSSTGTDENAVLLATEGVTAQLNNVTITRQSDDSTGGDSSSFYGVGAAALVTDGTLVISDSTITTDAAGGAGVFSYGDRTPPAVSMWPVAAPSTPGI